MNRPLRRLTDYLHIMPFDPDNATRNSEESYCTSVRVPDYGK